MRVMILIMMLLSAKISFAETPWYVGAGVGMTNYQGDSLNEVPKASIDVDGWETGFFLFGGYQFNERWAVEAGYTDFGETEDFDPDGPDYRHRRQFRIERFLPEWPVPYPTEQLLVAGSGWRLAIW